MFYDRNITPQPSALWTDYTPPGPWTDGTHVTRNIDGVLFVYSLSLNALTIIPNTSGSIKNANNFIVQNLPPPASGGDATNKTYVDSHAGGISDAPSDGTFYGRVNAAWGNVEPKITVGTTTQYWRGDKSWQTLDKNAVGLGNVDNTSDVNKPVSSATQTALNLKEDKANKGIANGYAPLDASGKVPAAQLPAYVDDVLEYPNLAAFPATGVSGIIYVADDTGKIYRWSGSIYIEISPSPGSTDSVPEGSVNFYYTNARASAAAPVQSVAGRQGAVTLTKADVGLGNVDNTSDVNKPISTATQTALNLKADKTYVDTQDASKQPLDADLTSLAAASGINTIYYRSAADTWSIVTIGVGLSFTGGSLSATGGGGNVSNSGTPTNGQLAQWINANQIQGINVSSLGFISEAPTDGVSYLRNGSTASWSDTIDCGTF